MKKRMTFIITLIMACMAAGTAYGDGVMITSELWIKAVIHTVEKGAIDGVWEEGGRGSTVSGDVVWGHFYASPADVSWGNRQNPDLFVKIWLDQSGRIDVNYFHVSVPNIEVYSDYPYDGTPDQQGMTTLGTRYIRQYYDGNGQSGMETQYEDGVGDKGYVPAGNPSGHATSQNLRIGARINTVEKGLIDAVWHNGGQGDTAGGHSVLWGHFYASPGDVGWGDENNPDLFVKIWFDASGRVDVNFFHVSVPEIEVYSDMPENNVYDHKGTTLMADRYIRHTYQITGEKQAPVAKFTTTLSSDTTPLTVTLDASESYDPDGQIATYQWTNSEDPGKVWDGQRVELTLPDSGTYTFTLTVTDNDGLQKIAQQTAEVKWPDMEGTEFEVAEFLLTTDAPPDECETPASSGTEFSDADRKVIAWVRYHNIEKGKLYQVKWHSPDSPDANPVQTDEGSRDSDFISACSWVSISTAKLQEYAPGQWTVKFYYDGQKYEERTFDFSAEDWGTDFKVTEFVFTSETPDPDECDTPAYQTMFSESDTRVIAWTRHHHAAKDKSYEYRWYAPNGILAQKSRGVYEEDAIGGCSYISIPTETLSGYGSGQWNVQFYYDDHKYQDAYFTFTSSKPGMGFEITDSVISGESPGNGCDTKPAPQAAFSGEDGDVFAWVHYRNLETGNKTYEFRWHNPGGRPDGEAAQVNKGVFGNDVSTGCSWAKISTETLRLYDPGQWTVEFHYDDEPYWTGTFTFEYATPFDVTELFLTTEYPENDCETPTASNSSFDDNDVNIFAWVGHSYAEAGKSYEFRWHGPGGVLAQKNTSSYSANNRDGCSWFSISSEKLRGYGSGQWQVEFYYDGEMYAEKTFTFTETRPRQFELTGFMFTHEYENLGDTCQQPASRTSFGDNDANVVAWLSYRDFEAGKQYEIRWHSPGGVLVQTSKGERSEDVSKGCSWPSISVEKVREYGPGQWTVKFYYDGQQYGIKTFMFVSDQPGKTFEITKFLFTTESPQGDCDAHLPSVTSFDDDNPLVTAWLSYRNFQGGEKDYAFKWYSPDGVLAQTNKGSGINMLSGGCLWASMLLEKLQGYSSGQWRVEFHYDGQKYDVKTFTFTSQHSDTAFEVMDFLFTRARYSSEDNCQAPESDTSFDKRDYEVTAWLHYRNLDPDKIYEFKWYSPEGNLSLSSKGTVDEFISRGCVWINISTEALEIRTPGQWRVVFFYDDQLYQEAFFTFE